VLEFEREFDDSSSFRCSWSDCRTSDIRYRGRGEVQAAEILVRLNPFWLAVFRLALDKEGYDQALDRSHYLSLGKSFHLYGLEEELA
jgi:hypothetical protein